MAALLIAIKALAYTILAPFISLPASLNHWSARAYFVSAVLLLVAIWHTWDTAQWLLMGVLVTAFVAMSYLWMDVFYLNQD